MLPPVGRDEEVEGSVVARSALASYSAGTLEAVPVPALLVRAPMRSIINHRERPACMSKKALEGEGEKRKEHTLRRSRSWVPLSAAMLACVDQAYKTVDGVLGRLCINPHHKRDFLAKRQTEGLRPLTAAAMRCTQLLSRYISACYEVCPFQLSAASLK